MQYLDPTSPISLELFSEASQLRLPRMLILSEPSSDLSLLFGWLATFSVHFILQLHPLACRAVGILSGLIILLPKGTPRTPLGLPLALGRGN